jgi:hypothetical protein
MSSKELKSDKWLSRHEFFSVFTRYLSFIYLVLSFIFFVSFIMLKIISTSPQYHSNNIGLFKNYLIYEKFVGSENDVLIGILDILATLFLIGGLFGIYGTDHYPRERFKGFVALLLHYLFSLGLAIILLILFPSLSLLVGLILLLGGLVTLIKSYISSKA